MCERAQCTHSPSSAYSAVAMATRQNGRRRGGGHPTASPDYVIKGRPPPPLPHTTLLPFKRFLGMNSWRDKRGCTGTHACACARTHTLMRGGWFTISLCGRLSLKLQRVSVFFANEFVRFFFLSHVLWKCILWDRLLRCQMK